MSNVPLPRVVDTTAKTTTVTAPAGKHTIVDATSGAVTVNLPAVTSANAGAMLSVEKVDSSVNAVTVAGNIRGVGSSTLALALQRESVEFLADATGSWWPIAGHKTLSSMDARYVLVSNAAPLAQAGQTPSQAPVAPTAAGTVGAEAFTARADHAHPSAGLYVPYGTGADGAINIDGSATVGKFTKISSTLFKLTGDVHATNLTIATGITVETAGFKVHVSGTLAGPSSGSAAVFTCSQPALTGTNQQTVAGGTTSLVIGASRYATLGYGQLGKGGGTGVGTAAAAPSGSTTSPQYAGIVNLPGNTTNGAGGAGSSGAGGTGLPAPGPTVPNVNDPLTAFVGVAHSSDAAAAAGTPLFFGVLMGGIGGASGAGDGTNPGGAGGQGGNVVIVNARIVTGKINVTAPGQAGGTPTTGFCGGGGGGTGGAALLNSTDLTAWTGAVSAAGGAGGSGVGTGTAGTAGVAGVAAATQWA